MAVNIVFKFLSLALVSVILVSVEADLKYGFYDEKCPHAEAIVLEEMKVILSEAPHLSGPLLRMHFHDCFVRGCDGSVLLNSKNGTAEKNAIPNLTIRGFSSIERLKRKLEEACPETVSCADIIAMAARDSVYLTQGPYYKIETGRRDGNVSIKQEALNFLPPPSSNISALFTFFTRKGLSAKDLVVLSGAHTIGTSHCSSFTPRLYNFTGRGGTDPSIDKEYVNRLEKRCSPNDTTTLVEMDPGSSLTFDLGYYKDVAKRRGLFVSDDALLRNSDTKSYLLKQAHAASPDEFFKDFVGSMINMGRIQVRTGNDGEIRKICGSYVD